MKSPDGGGLGPLPTSLLFCPCIGSFSSSYTVKISVAYPLHDWEMVVSFDSCHSSFIRHQTC